MKGCNAQLPADRNMHQEPVQEGCVGNKGLQVASTVQCSFALVTLPQTPLHSSAQPLSVTVQSGLRSVNPKCSAAKLSQSADSSPEQWPVCGLAGHLPHFSATFLSRLEQCSIMPHMWSRTAATSAQQCLAAGHCCEALGAVSGPHERGTQLQPAGRAAGFRQQAWSECLSFFALHCTPVP